MVELEGGLKRCKKYQKRSKATGHCRNRSGSQSRSRSPWKRSASGRLTRMRGGHGGEVVEGGAKTPCKKYQKRSKSTGRCKNVLARMSPKMRKSKSKSRSRKMHGGEVIEGGENIEGGEVIEVVEGGAKKPCKKYQKRSKSTGHCKNVLARMSPTMRKSKSKSKSRSRKMHGGEVDVPEVSLEGGVVASEVVEGGAKKPCKRGKTRKGTGVCHKPKSRSRSRSRRM